ncbi:BURP domain-containing protein 5-like [Durio zibethinus]|uniref:BURP domain-containing protein 5-like n=1 Tax=Durio zibethinus TaxID=66656 RepID=A0A6P6ABS7_DURZI|nr:BURP domain-containing protein 5-like [Durio zibethinus]
MENAKGGLFTVDELHNNFHAGKMLPIFFPNKDPATSPFLPKKVADSIPFSSSKLAEILQLFSIPPGSSVAKSMEDTIKKCEYAPGKGETKTCATSLESMVDFVSGAFKVGPQDTRFITTTHPTMSTASLQNYRVLEAPKEIKSFRKVACHPMPYPYAVFFCHYDEDSSETRVFKVSMVGENTKDKVDAAAVCHMDSTSAALLNLTDKHGKSPMCHFFSAGDLIWVQ